MLVLIPYLLKRAGYRLHRLYIHKASSMRPLRRDGLGICPSVRTDNRLIHPALVCACSFCSQRQRHFTKGSANSSSRSIIPSKTLGLTQHSANNSCLRTSNRRFIESSFLGTHSFGRFIGKTIYKPLGKRDSTTNARRFGSSCLR